MSNIDPFVGTWKLDVAKSQFSPAWLAILKATPPKEETLVFQEVGTNELELTITGTQTDGKTIAGKSTWPSQGGAVKLQQSPLPEGSTIVSTRIDPNHSIATYMMNGRQIFVGHSVISENGQMMQTTFKGTDVQGKPFEQVAVFVRQ